jgi:hypothetical protein
MKWLSFNFNILKNIEIQLHLDVYSKEKLYNTNQVFNGGEKEYWRMEINYIETHIIKY